MSMRLVGFLTPLCALLLGASPPGIPVSIPSQPASPVAIQSCAAAAVDQSSAPSYGRFTSTTVMSANGRIVDVASPGAPFNVDQHIPMTPMYDSTVVSGWAQATNRSDKTVDGVVYEFQVFDREHRAIGTFYGARNGRFDKNVSIAPYATGAASPWNGSLSSPNIGGATCFVAFVRFSDGTSWQSPLATIPSR